ncbi:MAG: glycosyltransferase, partial [Caulobacteraceae bacterium]|nr:glycosyltransferase [Caulobacteraceae bacterium]
MIVKNEEAVLARCLDCIKDIVDEIVIVDTGSKDRTKEIALQYTNKVYDFEWIDDFAAARNFAFSKGTSEWLMWLDADDIIEKSSQDALLNLKKKLNNFSFNIIITKYEVSFDEDGNLELASLRERIVKKDKNFKWTGKVHETIKDTEGNNIFVGDIIIKHQKNKPAFPSERNLNIYKKMIEENIELDSRDLYHLAVEYLNINYYLEAIKYFNEAINKNLIRGLYTQAVCYLSECYIQINKYEESLDILFQYLKKYPPNKLLILKIAKTFWEQARTEEALKWCQMCLGIEDKHLDIYFDGREDWLPHQYIGNIYFAIGDYEKALKHNEILKEKFPNQSGFLKNEEQIKEK